MAVGVGQHADVILRLECRKRRARVHCKYDAGFEVVDLDVEVHLHLLVAGLRRPNRRDVIHLELECNAE